MLEENIILGDKIIKNAYFKEDLNFFFFLGGGGGGHLPPQVHQVGLPLKRGVQRQVTVVEMV
jgi:hypothetical protein